MSYSIQNVIYLFTDCNQTQSLFEGADDLLCFSLGEEAFTVEIDQQSFVRQFVNIKMEPCFCVL